MLTLGNAIRFHKHMENSMNTADSTIIENKIKYFWLKIILKVVKVKYVKVLISSQKSGQNIKI